MQKVRGFGTLRWMPPPHEPHAGIAVAPEGAVCLGCGYALVNLAQGKCPECGLKFDPADPTTLGPRTSPILQRLATATPPWWIVGLFVSATCCLLIVLSAPLGIHSDGAAVIARFASRGALVVIVPLAAAHTTAVLLQRKRGCKVRIRARWFSLFVVIVAAIFMHSRGTVFWLRWHFSKSSIQAIPLASEAKWQPEWIGTFRVSSVVQDTSGTIRLKLGFPDNFSVSGELQYGQTPVTWSMKDKSVGASDLDLGGGWWYVWDPT